mmetsp:Transcript_18168/g.45788  ORF Transcript_18168/g.45788 Transcript_18168/m.45788 type:complete len:275 (-) Transcript_18168:112-936(-)
MVMRGVAGRRAVGLVMVVMGALLLCLPGRVAGEAAPQARGGIQGLIRRIPFLGRAKGGKGASAAKGAKKQGGSTQEEDNLALMKDSVEKSIVINAAPDEVFEVATNFEEYPKWAGVRTCEVLERHRGEPVVHMTIKMFGHNLVYVLKYKNQEGRVMTWHAVSGTIKALVGRYDFISAGPNQTRVIYKLNVDPGFFVPGPVRQATSKMVAWCALKGLKKYTEHPSTKARLSKNTHPHIGRFRLPVTFSSLDIKPAGKVKQSIWSRLWAFLLCAQI